MAHGRRHEIGNELELTCGRELIQSLSNGHSLRGSRPVLVEVDTRSLHIGVGGEGGAQDVDAPFEGSFPTTGADRVLHDGQSLRNVEAELCGTWHCVARILEPDIDARSINGAINYHSTGGQRTLGIA